jgi:hypothetical protein
MFLEVPLKVETLCFLLLKPLICHLNIECLVLIYLCLSLKDLITMKRKTNVPKKAFMTEQVSSILQCKLPLKYKDPGCSTITCMIGISQIERTLLDLRESVNLLPYSVYVQLGLRELKLTSMTLQLADRSVKVPRGIVEDVLIKMDKFFFPWILLCSIRN